MKRLHTQTICLLVTAILTLGLSQAVLAKGPRHKVTVESADPAVATQGTEETVYVNGSGFDDGSEVSFLVTGTTDASQVDVIGVDYVSPSQLKARIRPKESALVTDYDIEVRTVSGRKGKGTTLFRVKQADVSCTGIEDKEPTIAYLTDSELVDGISTADIYLSTASGCDQYLLIEDASQFLPDTKQNEGQNRFIKNVSALRFTTHENRGWVVWVDYYQEPSPIIGLEVEFDDLGNVTTVSPEPVILYQSSENYDVLYVDVRANDSGQFEIVLLEKLIGASDRKLSLLNIDIKQKELIISGRCLVIDELGACYSFRYGYPRWGYVDDEVYVSLSNESDIDYSIITRITKVNEIWGSPVVVMAGDANELETSLGAISATGLMTYASLREITNKRGRVTGREREFWLIDLQTCLESSCMVSDGVKIGGPDENMYYTEWSKDERLLFMHISGSTYEIREYFNPLDEVYGPLRIEGVQDWDTSN